MSAVSELIGRVRSALGWATADRREEAKGKLQELDATDGSPTEADEERVIDQAEFDVRGDHGDLAPSADRPSGPSQVPPTGG